ncbi:MAG TPA: flagellar filament capping protein FliD [Rhodanobacteraceae bacterium]|nr:flagellar filament capping protein FliD [Rhodanobacteraceae bacterium]
MAVTLPNPISTSTATSGSGTTGSSASSGNSALAGTGLLSSLGVGSGLNVNMIVNALVQQGTQAQQDQINNGTAAVQTQTSAIGQLQSLLSAVQTTLGTLADGSAFSQLTATSSKSSDFSATATSSAVPGVYQVQVQQLAAAQQVASGAFAANAAVGTGTLALSVGGQSTSITIDSSNDTLSGIAAAINGASNNPGVSATIIQATDGDHLVLTSTATGVANAFSVSASGGNGGLSALTWDASTSTGSLSQQTAAQDAKVTVDGFTATSATDVISNPISGVTINAAQADPGTTDTLTVAPDASTMQTDVQAFVSAYNSYVQGAQNLSSYDATSGTAGPLLGDPTLMTIQSQLATVLSGQAGTNANLNTLGAAGITLQDDGTLSVDTTKLGNTFAENPQALSNLFSSTSGYASQLNKLVNGYLGTGGLIDSENQTLNAESQQLQTQQQALQAYTAQLQQMYVKEYSNLDVTMSDAKQTTSFLTSQLASLQALYTPQSSSSSGS